LSLPLHARFRFAKGLTLHLSKGAKAMLVANVCLAAILAGEILSDTGAPPPTNSNANQLASSRSAASNVNSISTTNVPVDLAMVASKIVARPLFAADRRPVHLQGVSAAGTTVAELPVRLVGTIVSDRIRVAFLELGDQRITRMVGDNVRSSRVVEIDRGLIRLQSSHGEINDVRLSLGTRIEPTAQPALSPNLLRQ